MAYYTKNQVSDFIKKTLQRAKDLEIKILVNIEECALKLGDEEDLIPMFWVEINQDASKEGEVKKIHMDGVVFVRLEFDLYCDDRYAIDCYQACKEGVPVSEVIKKRIEETSRINNTPTDEKDEVAKKLNDALRDTQQNF